MADIEQIKKKSDEEVLALSIATPDAFSVLVERYEEAFVRKCAYILKESEITADIVQEVFVKIYINASRFRVVPGATFKSWAYKILVNECFTYYRKRKREREFSISFDPELAEIIPDAQMEKTREVHYLQEELLSYISKLPELLRRAVTMHFIEGKPQQAIAEAEGVAPNVIRARIHRAKKELRKIHLNI